MTDHRSSRPLLATTGCRVRSARWRLRPLGTAWSTAVVLATAACAGPVGSAAAPTVPALINGTTIDRAIPASVLDLPFVDATGEPVTLASLRGRTVVVADFLTTCQEICPMTSVNLRDLADALIKAGQTLSLIHISEPTRPY